MLVKKDKEVENTIPYEDLLKSIKSIKLMYSKTITNDKQKAETTRKAEESAFQN